MTLGLHHCMFIRLNETPECDKRTESGYYSGLLLHASPILHSFPAFSISLRSGNVFEVYFKDPGLPCLSFSAFLMRKKDPLNLGVSREDSFFRLKNLGAPGLCPASSCVYYTTDSGPETARESTVTKYSFRNIIITF